jgi:predicted DNA-binding transcriptional regulator AlpA
MQDHDQENMRDQDQEQIRSIALIRKVDVAKALSVSTWTIDRWCREAVFPPPLYITPQSPAVWRIRDIEAFLEKRRRSRRKRPTERGQLKQHRRRLKL